MGSKNKFVYFCVNLTVFILLMAVIEVFSFLTLHLRDVLKNEDNLNEQYRLNEMTFSKDRLFKTYKQISSGFQTTAEDGFRSHWETKTSPMDTYKKDAINIFAFGGSSTFGSGVNDDGTWPYLLQQLLSVKNKNYRVSNFGVGTFALHDETYLLTQLLIAGKKPDIAVFFDGVNEDICPMVDRSEPYRDYFENPIYNAIKTTSTYKLISKIKGKIVPSDSNIRNVNLTKEQYESCARTNYVNYVSYINQLSAKFGFKSIFVLQPNGSLIDNYADYSFPFYGNPGEPIRDYYNKYYDAILFEAKNAGVINIVDRRNLFSSQAKTKTDLFVDWQHPALAGNAIVAAEVLKIIMSF